jgi:aryl-alcohol dehydrogenase-like predicted oxidoreductase
MSFSRISRRDAIKTSMTAAAGLALVHPFIGQAQSSLPPITKPVPSSGEQIPVIGLGTNAYSANTAEEIAPLREVLDNMHRLGGTVIDTARVYGRSEEVIGQILEELDNRDRYFVASKTPIGGDFSDPEAVLNVSLSQLRVDTLDLMMIHNLGGTDELMPTLLQAKEQGRVRYVGMSTSSDNQYPAMMDAMRRYPLDFIQVDYSIDNRTAANEMLPLAQERGIGVMINTPFGGRRNAAGLFAQTRDLDLPSFAADIDVSSWAQLFLKFVVSHPAVTVAIPGTTRLSNLQDNQLAGRGRLPDADMRREIERYWESVRT